MNTPFFSIIIPTYNRAHLISVAIDSVIGQTFEDWELIIVDDGSKDHTKALVAGYQEKDPRIIYIYQENAERSAARNNGISHAKGEYLCFLDSDDYFLEKRLENLYQFIQQSKHLFYYTGICFKNGINDSRLDDYPFKTAKNDVDFVAKYIIGTPQVCIHHSLLRKERFNTRFSIGEDKELWMRLIVLTAFYFIENEASVVADDHEDRSVNLKKNNSGLKQLETYRYLFHKNHPGYGVQSAIKRALIANSYFSIFKYYFYNKNRFNAIRYLILSIFEQPNHEQTKYKFNLLIKLCLGKSFGEIERIL